MMRKAYYGKRVEYFKLSEHAPSPAVYYDISSAYPASMMSDAPLTKEFIEYNKRDCEIMQEAIKPTSKQPLSVLKRERKSSVIPRPLDNLAQVRVKRGHFRFIPASGMCPWQRRRQAANLLLNSTFGKHGAK